MTMPTAGQNIPQWLEQIHRRLPGSVDDWGIGPADVPWMAWHDDQHPCWSLLYQTFEDQFPGLDRKGQAAFCIGHIAYRLGMFVAAINLIHDAVPTFSPAQLGFSWQTGPDVLPGAVLALVNANNASVEVSTAADLVHKTRLFLTDCLTPIVSSQLGQTRLSRGAQWRLVSDALASAWLFMGQQLQQEARAKTVIENILNDKTSVLHNTRTQFIDVAIPGKEHTFVSRGGCCRYYTANEGDYCMTCLHRKPEQQTQLMREWYQVSAQSIANTL